MIISYPILPAGADTGDEDARLTSFLSTYVDSASGFYPVSFEDRWHGGVHLKPGKEPLRAVADGEVVCYRVAAQAETYPGQGDYDTSFVLLKHSTETGENTPVVFYSLLMHLLGRSKLTADQQKQLPDWLKNTSPGPDVKPGKGQKVWRKEVLGFSGQYMGDERVHFEIFTADADLNHFWKDSTAIATGGHGSDDFFGDAGFIIPAGSSFSAAHPHAAAIHDVLSPPQEAPAAGSNADSPATAPTTPTFDPSLAGNSPQGQATSGEIYVSVRFDRGTRIATSHRKLPSGKFVQIGQPIRETEYEYKLYELATKLYTDCPSAGYEWLRFGRILGPDTTVTQENWQLIRYDDTKSGYINLAANTITKLSDADFPFWLGWQKISEGSAIKAQDGLCDVPRLLELLHGSAPATTSTPSLISAKQDFIAHATSQDVVDALHFVVVQHPSEWDDSDLEVRYAKERQSGMDLAEENSWNDFKDHVKKMALWTNTGLDRSIWHFHPIKFINHYRKCLWLSEKEIIQCIPRNFIAEYHKTHTLYRTRVTHGQAQSRTSTIRIELNKTTRKFIINSTMRLSCFLANAIVESTYLSQYYEGGRGAGHTYGDWYGRGIIQLTHQDGYLHYFKWRGWKTDNQQQNITRRDAVETNNHERTESAGYWWAKNKANTTCDTSGSNAPWNVTVCENFDWHTRTCTGAQTREQRLSNSTLDLVARHVNTGSPNTTHAMNGLPERRDIFINDQSVLMDTFYSSPTDSNVLTIMPSYMTRQS